MHIIVTWVLCVHYVLCWHDKDLHVIGMWVWCVYYVLCWKGPWTLGSASPHHAWSVSWSSTKLPLKVMQTLKDLSKSRCTCSYLWITPPMSHHILCLWYIPSIQPSFYLLLPVKHFQLGENAQRAIPADKNLLHNPFWWQITVCSSDYCSRPHISSLNTVTNMLGQDSTPGGNTSAIAPQLYMLELHCST